jgi:hypothetical protein
MSQWEDYKWMEILRGGRGGGGVLMMGCQGGRQLEQVKEQIDQRTR